MCGSIRYEKVGDKIGKLVIPWSKDPNGELDYIDRDGKNGAAPFFGHSRDDKPQPANSVLVKLTAKYYTEKSVEFMVPEGKGILAYLVSSKNFPGRGQGLFIITRNATNEELSKCKHPRHPKFG